MQEQALIQYEATILTALEDVENGVSAFTNERLRYKSLQQAEQAACTVLNKAQLRFDEGDSSYLNVLDAQRTLLGLQDSLAQSEGPINTNLVRLYKALGGGWDPSQ